MTYSQGQERRAKRSRILGSIFARTPRDTPVSQGRAASVQHRPSNVSTLKYTQTTPVGWRDVTARIARETLAESLCSRFFTREQNFAAAVHEGTPEAGFMTAGQRLQALSKDAERSDAGHHGLAAVLEASSCSAGSHEVQDAERAGASLQSLLTAEAA